MLFSMQRYAVGRLNDFCSEIGLLFCAEKRRYGDVPVQEE